MVINTVEISEEGIVYCGNASLKLACAYWLDTTERCSNCPLNNLVGKL